jgi:hypothetical protein
MGEILNVAMKIRGWGTWTSRGSRSGTWAAMLVMAGGSEHVATTPCQDDRMVGATGVATHARWRCFGRVGRVKLEWAAWTNGLDALNLFLIFKGFPNSTRTFKLAK